jgi:aquaporin Z
MKKYVAEFLGTFFLVLVIALTGNPIAIGAVLVALVYMGGYVSGAQYNPAVTLALWISKKMPSKEVFPYMLTQLVAGLAAAIVYFVVTGMKFVPQMNPGISFTSALVVEILFTFLLASVVLHVAATEKTKGNEYFGLAIGLTVMAIAFAGGPISGGAFNPAVGVGPLLFDSANLGNNTINLLLYLIGPFIGGGLAGLVYKKLS